MNSGNNHFFITGASGFLGRTLVQQLLVGDPSLRLSLLEHHTRIVVPEKYRARVTVITSDFGNLHTLEGVDAVIHLAAMTHAKHKNLYHAVNTEWTKTLLKLAKDSGVKHFVYVSTTALGDSCGTYGASKLKGEEAVQQSGLPYTIVRFAEVYGGESREGIERLINVVKSFPIVPYVTNTFLAPVYVDDATAALSAALYRTPENKTYIIAGPERLSFRVAVQIIASVCGKKIVRVPIPQVFMQIVARVLTFLSAPDQVERLIGEKNYDNSLARQDLNFSPRSFREGLKKVIVGDNKDVQI